MGAMTEEPIKSLFARAPTEYRTRKAKAEKAVVRWEWWRKPRYPLDPLFDDARREGAGVEADRHHREGEVSGRLGKDQARDVVLEGLTAEEAATVAS